MIEENSTDLESAIAEVTRACNGVAKNTKGYNYTYADLSSVMKTIKPHLEVNFLTINQIPTLVDQRDVLETRIYHQPSRKWTAFITPIIYGKKDDPQAYGSGVTYARRYAILSFFGLIPGDDDGDSAVHRPHHKQAEQKFDRNNPAHIDKLSERLTGLGLDLASDKGAKILEQSMRILHNSGVDKIPAYLNAVSKQLKGDK